MNYIFYYDNDLWYAIPKEDYDKGLDNLDSYMKARDVMVLVEIIRKNLFNEL